MQPFTQEEMDNGVVLNAAVLLKDPPRDLEKVLDRMASMPANRHKILILDAVHMPVSWDVPA